MMANYSYSAVKSGVTEHWRVQDKHDNRVATCYLEENAQLVTKALNEVVKLRERAEAAERELAEWIGRVNAESEPVGCPLPGCCSAQAAFVAIRARAEAAERERDQLRDEVAWLRGERWPI